MPYRPTSPHGRAAHLRSGLSTLAIAAALACALPAGNAIAQADTATTLSIAAQPLGQALLQLGQQSDVHIYYQPELVRGQTAPAINGTLSPRQALAQLLAGSGLVADINGKEVVVRRAPPRSSSPATLPEVVVMAPATVPGITEGTGSFTTDSTSAATGMNLSLRETPQSISVMTRERMDQQQLNSLQDVLDQTIGIYATNEAGIPSGNGASLFSRGYNISNYQVDGAVSTWQTLIGNEGGDGVSSLDTAIYDSLTVVRGATGLLTGAGDPSGSINLTRKRPTNEFSGSLEVGLGRWDKRRLVADLGGSINDAGTLRSRFVGAYDEGGYWAPNYKNDRSILYGIVEADVSEKTLISVSFEQGRDKSNLHHGTGSARLFYNDGSLTPFDRYDYHYPDWAKTDVKKRSISISLDHHFNTDWLVRGNYTRGSLTLYEREGDVNRGGINTDNTFPRLQATNGKAENKSDALDIKLSGRYALFDRKHDLVAGFNRSDYSNQYAQKCCYGPHSVEVVPGGIIWKEPDWTMHGSPSDPSSDSKSSQYGAFLSTRILATDKLSLIFGGRWSGWNSKTLLTEYQTWQPPGTITDDRRYSGIFTPYAGAVYDLSENISVYASYTEIFQPQYNKDVNGRLLDPEQGKNHEIGLKGEWFNGRLNTSIAVFRSGKDGLAVADGENKTPEGGQAYVSHDDTKVRGWELEAAGELTRGWNLQGGYSQTILRDSDGNRLNTDRPVSQFRVFTSYTPPIFSKLTLGGGLKWRSKGYSSSQQGIQREIGAVKSHAIVNAMARYAITDQFIIGLNINNLFNKQQRISTTTHSYVPERNFYASLKYQF